MCPSVAHAAGFCKCIHRMRHTYTRTYIQRVQVRMFIYVLQGIAPTDLANAPSVCIHVEVCLESSQDLWYSDHRMSYTRQTEQYLSFFFDSHSNWWYGILKLSPSHEVAWACNVVGRWGLVVWLVELVSKGHLSKLQEHANRNTVHMLAQRHECVRTCTAHWTETLTQSVRHVKLYKWMHNYICTVQYVRTDMKALTYCRSWWKQLPTGAKAAAKHLQQYVHMY